MNEYHYIPDMTQSPEALPQSNSPFRVEYDQEQPESWRNIENQVNDFFQPRFEELLKKHHKLDEVDPSNRSFREEADTLTLGAVNLINFIVQRNKDGEPVDTLVFLDKSARNAAYLLNIFWQSLLELPVTDNPLKSIKKPLIKFIDVGKLDEFKPRDSLATEMLGKVFPVEDLRGNVLVVDEASVSGRSLRDASKALLEAGYPISSIEGISNFQAFPAWYNRTWFKGISEPEKIRLRTRTELAKLNPADREELFLEAQKSKLSSRNPLRKIVSLLTGKGRLHELMEKLDIKDSDANELYDYVKTVGGYQGVAPDSLVTDSTRLYREALKMMVQEVFKQKLVQMA